MKAWDLINSLEAFGSKIQYNHVEESTNHKTREWVLVKYNIKSLGFLREKLP